MLDSPSARILYMDDDAGLRRLLQKRLERAGYAVDTVADGEHGLAMVEGGSYEVVFVDHAMPGLGGLEVLRALQSRKQCPPVVMVTGIGSEQLAVAAMKEGAADYLVKDCEARYLDLLPAVIEKAVAQRHAEEALQAGQQEARRFSERLTTLHEVTNELTRAGNFDELCLAAVELGRSRLGFERLGLWFVGSDSTEAIGAFGVDEEGGIRDERGQHLKVSPESVLGRLFRREALSELRREDPLLNDMGAPVGSGDHAVAGLWDGEKIVGCLCLDNLPTGESITERDRELLVLYASALGHLCTRKRAEAERERLATAIEQVPDTIVITDPAGTIQYVNPAFTRITGYSREEAIGENPRLLKSGQHDEDFYRELWDTLGRGEVWSGEFVNRRRDGTHYQEEAVLSPVREAGGSLVGYVAVKRDVTHERRVQKELEEQNRLATVGQLAAGIAHEFNNLLTGMMGTAQLMQIQDRLSARAEQRVAVIYEQGQRAARLISQLLDFSRKSVLVRLRPLDLVGLVRESAGLIRQRLPANVSLSIDTALRECLANADVTQVERVLENVTANAIHALRGGGELRIGVSRLTVTSEDDAPAVGMAPGNWVALSVQDNGVGMPGAVVERMFEPFYTTKDVGQGSGLGLAQVYGIVQQHQGAIQVQSAPGKGTTLTVYLPAYQVAADAQETAEPPPAEPVTLLVVEHEPRILQVLRDMLAGLGYEVLTAADDAQAAGVYDDNAERVQAAVLGVGVPGPAGWKLLQSLRLRDPSLHAVAVTGYPLREDSPSLQEPGVAAWVQTPTTMKALHDAVGKAVAARKAAAT